MTRILMPDTLIRVLEQDGHVLSRSEFSIIAASSAETMLDIHRKERVDLVIAELETPRMGGDLLCRALRDSDDLKDVSVLLISPNNREAIDRCLSCGANDLVLRPHIGDELLNKAAELLRIPHRGSLRVLMNIAIAGKSRTDFFSTSQNISTSGVLLETDRLLQRGDRLEISFFLRLNRLTIRGEVARVMKKGPKVVQYGIKFLDLEEHARVLIEEFIRIRKAC